MTFPHATFSEKQLILTLEIRIRIWPESGNALDRSRPEMETKLFQCKRASTLSLMREYIASRTRPARAILYMVRAPTTDRADWFKNQQSWSSIAVPTCNTQRRIRVEVSNLWGWRMKLLHVYDFVRRKPFKNSVFLHSKTWGYKGQFFWTNHKVYSFVGQKNKQKIIHVTKGWFLLFMCIVA